MVFRACLKSIGRLKIIRIFSLLFLLTTFAGCTRKFDPKDTTLHTYARENINTLDPIHAHDLFSHQMAAQVYEGLYHFHYLDRPLRVEPLLASELPAISNDGKTYTIPLKKNIRFHPHPSFKDPNNRFFVAEDFIYSIKRLADPKNKSESYWVVENKIVGLDEWRKNGASMEETIPGLRALDDHTLQIQLTHPSSQFIYNLTMAATYVVAREVVDFYRNNFGNYAIGTGAFRLEHWIRGSQFLFLKNPFYSSLRYPTSAHGEDKQNELLQDAESALPLLDRVIVYEIVEPQPQWLLFVKGDLDLLQPHKDYQPFFIQKQKLSLAAQQKKMELELPAGIDVTFIGINNEHPILKNKNVRKALSLVFNRAVSSEKNYNGLVQIAQGPIPPGLDGYDPSYQNPWTQYNVELAKKLLKEAGFPNGQGIPELNYELSSNHTVARQTAELFKQNLSQIGVRLRLITNTWPQFNDKVRKKKADLFEYSWNADYPDAENFLQLFYSHNISPGPNSANYKNIEFDQLYETSLKLPPSPQRTALYKKMVQIIVDDCPWIFGFHRLRPLVKQAWLKNHKYEIMIPDIMKYLKIDGLQRALLQETLL